MEGVVLDGPPEPSFVLPIVDVPEEHLHRVVRDPKPAPPDPGTSWRERALASAAALPPDQTVRVNLELREVPFDFSALAGLQGAARESAIAARKASLEPVQRPIGERLAQRGATNVIYWWLSNAVSASIVASAVPEVLSWSEVVNAQVGEGRPGPLQSAYNGLTSRDAMLTSSLIASGYTGIAGSRIGGGRTSIAVIEINNADAPTFNNNRVARNHVGWLDYEGTSFSRLAPIRRCSFGGCTNETLPEDHFSHGTAVTSIAAGSIEQNQDPDFSGLIDQIVRSGQASESLISYYEAFGCQDVKAALQEATSLGADVVNLSIQLTGNAYQPPQEVCNRFTDCLGLNAQLKNSLEAGVLPVAASGNAGYDTSYVSVVYPGCRPHTLTVTGVSTTDSSVPYESTVLPPGVASSARGPIALRTWTGVTGSQVNTAAIDLAAPGNRTLVFYTTSPSLGLYLQAGAYITGSSFATPQVAGTAALMRNAFWAAGHSPSARALMANLMLMGDRWKNHPVKMTTGVSSLTGFGRLRTHWIQTMVAPWAWSWAVYPMANGQTRYIPINGGQPMPSGVTQVKWVVTWFEDDLNNVADITIQLWEIPCPGGGGITTLIAEDFSYGLRKRLTLNSPSPIAGRCLERRIIGMSVPSAGRDVYVATYYHGGDLITH